MAEERKSLESENTYDEIKGYFPEEYDLTPEELLNTPDVDSFDSSEFSPIWEDLDKSNSTPEESKETVNINNNADPETDLVKEVKSPKKKDFIRDIYDVIEMFAICAACIIVFFSFFARLTIVDGNSMNDTLVDKEWLVISNFLYEPSAGDIVVLQDISLNHPALQKPLVKRVIATGEQTVDISSSGVVTITDKDGSSFVLDEKYIKDEPYFKSAGHFVVPQNCVFVMGDNRNGSTDSRDSRVGCIDERCIIGCAKFRLFPLDKFVVFTNPLVKE